LTDVAEVLTASINRAMGDLVHFLALLLLLSEWLNIKVVATGRFYSQDERNEKHAESLWGRILKAFI
jgi:hypothetical protein